jgi:hypothetical protein
MKVAHSLQKKEPTSVFNAGIVIEDIKHAKRDSVVFSLIHDSRTVLR